MFIISSIFFLHGISGPPPGFKHLETQVQIFRTLLIVYLYKMYIHLLEVKKGGGGG